MKKKKRDILKNINRKKTIDQRHMNSKNRENAFWKLRDFLEFKQNSHIYFCFNVLADIYEEYLKTMYSTVTLSRIEYFLKVKNLGELKGAINHNIKSRTKEYSKSIIVFLKMFLVRLKTEQNKRIIFNYENNKYFQQ